MPRLFRSIVPVVSAFALVVGLLAVAMTPVAASARLTEAPTATSAPDDLDLEQARMDARARASASPSAENFRVEAQLAEEAGDRAGAVAAYSRELEALPAGDPARARAKSDLARVRAEMRGRVVDEPESTHREALDRRWAPAKKVAPAPKGQPQPTDGPPKDDRIVKKWYFWVTIVAIAASAAAVTGIAVRASREDRPDALDRMAPAPGMLPGGIRF